jgi:hypothetical protein
MYLPRGFIGFSWKLHYLFYRKYNYKHIFSVCVSFHASCKIYMIGCCTPYQIYVVNGISNNAQKQEIKTISFYLASHLPFIIYRNNMQTIIIKLKSVCNYYQRTETKL